jgi:LPS sulfotransferase NodH
MHLTIDELLNYTDEERAEWRDWFSAHGNDPLKIVLANETHPTIGALIRTAFGVSYGMPIGCAVKSSLQTVSL